MHAVRGGDHVDSIGLARVATTDEPPGESTMTAHGAEPANDATAFDSASGAICSALSVALAQLKVFMDLNWLVQIRLTPPEISKPAPHGLVGRQRAPDFSLRGRVLPSNIPHDRPSSADAMNR